MTRYLNSIYFEPWCYSGLQVTKTFQVRFLLPPNCFIRTFAYDFFRVSDLINRLKRETRMKVILILGSLRKKVRKIRSSDFRSFSTVPAIHRRFVAVRTKRFSFRKICYRSGSRFCRDLSKFVGLLRSISGRHVQFSCHPEAHSLNKMRSSSWMSLYLADL